MRWIDAFGALASGAAIVVFSIVGNVSKTVPLYKLHFAEGDGYPDIDGVTEHVHISPVGICLFFLCVTFLAHVARYFLFRSEYFLYKDVVLFYSREFAISAPPMFVLFGYFSGCQTLYEAVFIYLVSFTLMVLIPTSVVSRACLWFSTAVYVLLIGSFAYSLAHMPRPPGWVYALIAGLYVSFSLFAVPVWLGIINTKWGISCFAGLSIASKLYLTSMLVGPGGYG